MSVTIISLHDLLRRELRELAQARYLPRGWTREGSTKVDAKMSELSGYLAEIISDIPDRLLAYPRRLVLDPLLYQAAQERTLRAMVAKLGTLVSDIPETDQASAYALAELADQQAGLERLKHQAQTLQVHIDKMKPDARVLNINLSEIDDALLRVSEALRTQENHIARVQKAHVLE